MATPNPAPSGDSPSDYLKQKMSEFQGVAKGIGVYWGAPTEQFDLGKGSASFFASAKSNVKTQNDAELAWFGFAPTEQQSWATKLYRAGLISDPGDYDQAFTAWRSAVAYAGNQYTYGQKAVTPWDVMQARIGLAMKTSGGTKTSTSTSTQKIQVDPADAEAMVKTVYQNALGRDPAPGELSRYKSMLINKVLANPQTTTTTTKTSGTPNNQKSTSNSSTSGGIDSAGQQQYLLDKAQADPEYGAYQAATKYFSLIQNAFAAPSVPGAGG